MTEVSRKMTAFAAFAAAGMMTMAAADTRLNLLKEETFRPVYLHGMVTAARGWSMYDNARYYSIYNKGIYVSGEECFKLSYADKVFSIVFHKPLNPIYKHGAVALSGRVGMVTPPAARYRVSGRVKFRNGGLEIADVAKLPETGGWQDFEYSTRARVWRFRMRPREGAEYHFARVSVVAEYPGIGGEIALPGGGRLTKLLIPENASYEMRYGIAQWRGWLWKLTGVALPVETVKQVDGPVAGALVALKGPEKPGHWSLKVDRNGIVVSCGTELEIANALFDYLRRGLDCAFYQRDCEKIPKQGSVKVLPALDFTAKPLFDYFNCCNTLCALQGAVDYNLLYSRNDVDYYHLSYDKSDHVFNVLVPQERYFKNHPEYFALVDGRRVTRSNPHFTPHCLTNPDLMKLVLDNAVEYAKAQYGPQRLVIDESDSNSCCQCPECVKFNNGPERSSNTVYEYHQRLAERVAKVRPDLVVERHSYASRNTPPDHIRELTPNSRLVYCMGDWACKLHTDCELNRPAIEKIKELRKLVGDDPERLSFMHYSDLRPLYVTRQMRELAKYGRDCNFFWVYKSFHPAVPFLLGRFNLGEDPEKLLHEFEEAYYGKGAPHVHEAFEIAEKFAINYKHTPDEIRRGARCSIWPDGFGRAETVMDRATFDRVHACFERALEAERDKKLRRHIYRDWFFFLTEDLNRYRAGSCRSDAELRRFARRVAVIVRAGRDYPGVFDKPMHDAAAREFLSTVTGVPLPGTMKNWADEPLLDKILKEPEKRLTRGCESFAGHGFYFAPSFFRTSREDTDEARPVVKVSEYTRNHLPLVPGQGLEVALPATAFTGSPLVLGVEAAVEAGAAPAVEIAVNGKTVYRGKASYLSDRWSRMGFTLPAELFKPGENTITVRNAAKSGWLAVSEIYTIDCGGDFRAFAAGGPALWRTFDDPHGELDVRCGGGKVTIAAPAGKEGGVYFFGDDHSYPKLAVTPGGKVKIAVTARGTGALRIGMIPYSPYELDRNGKQKLKPAGYVRHVGNLGARKSKPFRLGKTPKQYSATFDIPARGGLFLPGVVAVSGTAEITSVTVTVEQPSGL